MTRANRENEHKHIKVFVISHTTLNTNAHIHTQDFMDHKDQLSHAQVLKEDLIRSVMSEHRQDFIFDVRV